MIRHVVMWELHDAGNAQRFAEVLGECKALLAEVTGMRGFEIGVRTSALAGSTDVCLMSSFDDAAALAVYEQHPLHRGVSARLAPLRRARHVLDYESGDPAAIA